MRQSTVTSLIVASALALSASAAIAQKYPTRQYDDSSASYRALQRPDGNFGERRDVPYGQGGTAGTHETGANVGPGRAGMNHAN